MIKTKHLILRPLHEDDASALVRELNNYNITRHTGRVPYPYSGEDAAEYLQFVREQSAQSCIRAITLQNQLIGVISYLYSADKLDAELGYWLSENHWGNGLMSEAARAMIADGTARGITKFVACYHADNPVSANILRRLGFVEKGTCKNFSKAQGKDVEVVNMVLEQVGLPTLANPV
jgi:RimJ/RimL family protein N-acetyltransferase